MLSSVVIEDYPVLKAILERHKRVTISAFRDLAPGEQDLLDDMFNPIFKQAAREWRVLEDKYNVLDGETGQCMLCGTQLKYEWFIGNQITGEELLVGRECADKFGIETDGKKSRHQLHQERLRLGRRDILNSRYRGMHDAISDLQNYLNSTAILPPKRLEDPLVKTGEALRRKYRAYLDGEFTKGNEDEKLEVIGRLWGRLGEKKESIDAYVLNHKGDRCRPSRRIVRHLLETPGAETRQTIEWLKVDEVITARTLYRISEPEFLRMLIPEWNKVLWEVGIIIDRVDTQKPNYIFRWESIDKVRLAVEHFHLAFLYGNSFFDPNTSPKQVPLKSLVGVSDLFVSVKLCPPSIYHGDAR